MDNLGKYIQRLMIENEERLTLEGKIKGKRKLSRNYMAKEVLNVSGTWFSSIVNGEKEPSDELLIEIARFFEIDEREIFYVAERVHPEDYEVFKSAYLKGLGKSYKDVIARSGDAIE